MTDLYGTGQTHRMRRQQSPAGDQFQGQPGHLPEEPERGADGEPRRALLG
jgi:hypothetical protein